MSLGTVMNSFLGSIMLNLMTELSTHNKNPIILNQSDALENKQLNLKAV
jgi:hypothetical protein